MSGRSRSTATRSPSVAATTVPRWSADRRRRRRPRERPQDADDVPHRRHLDMPRGGLGDFLDWWVVLRSLLDGRPVHTRRRGRLRRSRRRAARPAPRLHPRRRRRRASPTSSPKPGSCTSAACSTRARDGRDLRRHGRCRRPTTRDGDGRSWWARTARRRRPLRPHAVLPRRVRRHAPLLDRRPSPAHRPASPTTATPRQARRQPNRSRRW